MLDTSDPCAVVASVCNWDALHVAATSCPEDSGMAIWHYTPGKVSSGILNFTPGSDTQGIPSKLLQAKPLGDGLGVRDSWWKGLVGSSLLGPLCLACLENPKTGGQN